MRIQFRLRLLLLAGFTCGCAGVPRGDNDATGERPKTLLTWAVGKEDDEKRDKQKDEVNGSENGNEDKGGKNGKTGDGQRGRGPDKGE